MTNKKTIVLTTVIVAASFSILSITGFSLNEIIAEEIAEDKGYNFAEDTLITGIFDFRDGTEISRFEVFDQKQGFQGRETFVFELEKVVGSTPLLHKASDESYQYRNSPSDRQTNAEFDVKIVISQGSEQKRAFSYSRCFVNDNSVDTKTDNEEGWTQGKGFAVIDKFEIQCMVMEPHNPVYEDMTSNKEVADTQSSMDYQSKQLNLGRQ
jgi:hypothetical protein